MISSMVCLALFLLIGLCCWYSVYALLSSVLVFLALSLLTVYGNTTLWYLIVAWGLFLAYVVFRHYGPLRRRCLSLPVLNYLRKALPPISETERIALEAGDVWLDGDLFRGAPNWKKIDALRAPSLSQEEQQFLDNETEHLCAMLDDWSIVHESGDLPPAVWTYMKSSGFFGLIIPQEYGGKAFSALAHSTIVTKIASRSISAAVTVMVPNSLGPAELLLHYGTDDQKRAYLPKLATGEEMPCFALTGPEAGSDAGAIGDHGVVFAKQEGKKQRLFIRLSWDKRYITLSPVATVLGVAFKLSDPEGLLNASQKNIGITVVLIPSDHPGVELAKRHSPLNLAFMNGTTRGKDVEIPLEWIIGGQDMAGHGWRMLMECLSIGRSISLPALATATAKLSYRMTGAYARVRQQFRVPIAQFEGVEEALARIAGYSYMMDAVRLLTADAVGQGVKPSLVSAITKYHLTEKCRVVINDAMDVHAGRGIQFGPRNYLGIHYTAVPVSITVEGANILTRNLMIFGQGAMRCHPFIRDEIEAANADDSEQGLLKFDKLFLSHAAYVVRNSLRSLGYGLTGGRLIWVGKKPSKTKRYYKQLTRMSTALAMVSDAAMVVLGGDLKRRERLSARLGDVLSHLYIGVAVLKYYRDQANDEDIPYLHWTLQSCLDQIQQAFKQFFSNFPNRPLAWVLKRIIFPWGDAYRPVSDKLSHQMVQSMLTDSDIRERITRHCYVGEGVDDPTGRMEMAFKQCLAVSDIEKFLQTAQKGGQLPRNIDHQTLLQQALDAGIIDEGQAEALRSYERLRRDAMRVDEFE